MSFIEYFDKQYAKYRKEVISIIKNELQRNKQWHHNFAHAYNSLHNILFAEIDKVIPPEHKQMLEGLFKVYNTRGKIYDAENLKLILDNEARMKYDSMTSPGFSYNYFIDVLAKRESYFETYNEFRNHSRTYEMMFQLNRFDNYENMMKFDILKPGQKAEDTPIHLELKKLVYGHPKVATKKAETKPYSKENYFKIKEYYAEALKSRKTFDYLIERDFLDADKNKYENFENLMSGNFPKKPKLYFKCTTKYTSLIIKTFKNNFFDTLNYKWLLNKELIIDREDNPIKQTTISSTTSRHRDEKLDEITHFIDFVEQQAKNLANSNS